MKKENEVRGKIITCIKTVALFMVMITTPFISFAQDETAEAKIALSFSQTDSTKTCKILLTADSLPIKEKEVQVYVKRLFGLHPIKSSVETDENGEATVEFPNDFPGDKNGMLQVVARLEDDDDYGTVESTASVKWGVVPESQNDHWGKRSLSASRDHAPMYLIVVSNLIIAIIWGTLVFIVFQIFKIKKASKLIKK